MICNSFGQKLARKFTFWDTVFSMAWTIGS